MDVKQHSTNWSLKTVQWRTARDGACQPLPRPLHQTGSLLPLHHQERPALAEDVSLEQQWRHDAVNPLHQWPAFWTHCTLGRCLMWHYFTWKTRNAQTASVWPHVMHSPFSWVLSVRWWTKAHENCVALRHFATLKKTVERSQKWNSNYFIQKSRNWKNKNKKPVQSEYYSTQFSKD